MDVQLNDINRGSFRVYCMKQNSNESKFSTQPYRDVCNFRINSLLEYEKTLNLDKEETWLNFYDKRWLYIFLFVLYLVSRMALKP